MGSASHEELQHLRDLLGDWPTSGSMLTVSLADALGRLIGIGALREGTRLPSAQRLSRVLSISRPTVHDAYDLLAVQGLIDKRSRTVKPAMPLDVESG